MLLTTSFANEFLEADISSQTAIEPGEQAAFKLNLRSNQRCIVNAITFMMPDVASFEISEEFLSQFPLTIEAGDSIEWELPIISTPTDEGFGVIESQINFSSGSTEVFILNTDTWISVYKQALATEQAPLNDELRERLIKVVNARTRNGHIFLADYVRFFEDFLNIQVPQRLVEVLSEEFGLPIEGLPVDEETRIQIIWGDKTFYGIEELELIAEEDCNESDDRFDPYEAREVKLEEV